jgi:hypothetical protein
MSIDTDENGVLLTFTIRFDHVFMPYWVVCKGHDSSSYIFSNTSFLFYAFKAVS